jgi:hypothetical protein
MLAASGGEPGILPHSPGIFGGKLKHVNMPKVNNICFI